MSLKCSLETSSVILCFFIRGACRWLYVSSQALSGIAPQSTERGSVHRSLVALYKVLDKSNVVDARRRRSSQEAEASTVVVWPINHHRLGSISFCCSTQAQRLRYSYRSSSECREASPNISVLASNCKNLLCALNRFLERAALISGSVSN